MGITAKDIANMLGVSPSAVSIAINGKPGVSDELREKILEVAQLNNYKVNLHAPKKTLGYLIYYDDGVIAKDVSFSSFVLQGIDQEAKSLGYNVSVAYFYDKQDQSQQLNEFLSGVDGVIVLGTELKGAPENYPFIKKIQETHSLIIVDHSAPESDIDCIKNDNFRSAYSALEYLRSKGHSKIGYLRSPQHIQPFYERFDAVSRLMSVAPELDIRVVDVPFGAESVNAICEWITRQQRDDHPTAFFADYDVLACRAITAFNICNLSVPDDVSIIGIDDGPYCELVTPPLTTVHVNMAEIGGIAVKILHARIGDSKTQRIDYSKASLCMQVSNYICERNSVSSLK